MSHSLHFLVKIAYFLTASDGHLSIILHIVNIEIPLQTSLVLERKKGNLKIRERGRSCDVLMCCYRVSRVSSFCSLLTVDVFACCF